MSDRQTRAEQFYQELTAHSDPVAFLRGLITQSKAEDEFLEFKGATRIADKDAKQYWSQALSGFANTEGGVLIWGIRAARIKSPTDPSRTVDAASELDFVPHPETFLQMLKDVRLEATVDPVQGVEYKQYDAGQGDGAGFVICLIPEGVHKPYRAAIDPAKQYYQRVGDSFVVIPHSMLRSLFYPRIAPRLCLEVLCTKSSVTKKGVNAEFLALLINRGSASARELRLCQDWLTPNEYTFSLASGWNPVRNDDANVVGGAAIETLHPGQRIEFGTVRMARDSQAMESKPLPGDLHFDLDAYMSDQPPQIFAVEFSKNEILRSDKKEFVAFPKAFWD